MRVHTFIAPLSAQKPLGPSYSGALNEKNILSLAMTLESANDHPVAQAIVSYCRSQSAETLPVSDFAQTPGAGVAARVNAYGKNMVVIIGSPESVAHSAVALDHQLQIEIERAQAQAQTISLLAVDGVAIALFATGDIVKADAAKTIVELAARGVESWLVTGDHAESAAAIASAVGIPPGRVLSSATPEGKIEQVRHLQSAGHKVLMVGDGINDAAALAQADLSIAMGTGTDTAISTADLTLMRPQLMGVVGALDLSARTLRTIRTNLAWAFGYNVIGLPIAALGLMSPMYAAGAMALSSLFVVTNSLRIR
jgi:Cu+-exporting ATPase